jgi:rhodanese-related sulfurtransferase
MPNLRTGLFTLITALSLLGCGQSTEAPSAANEPAAAAPMRERSVDEVDRLLGAGSIAVFDANGEETRRREGIVPGARLLSSSGRFDPATELPASKTTPLVFYCGNTECTASDGAAERAREAGWSDVSVMRAGIAGWRAAGKPTTPHSS